MTARRAPPVTTGDLPAPQQDTSPPFDGGQAITRSEPPSANRLEKITRRAVANRDRVRFQSDEPKSG